MRNHSLVPVIYVLDGNAHFFTAVEAVRRALAMAPSRDAIVVGIGYPDCGHYVFGRRRAFDLTPPCENYVAPKGWEGHLFTLPHGGANEFLTFIQGPLRRRVLGLFPGLVPDREILAGHSFGGLFVLHALFAGDTRFDTFIALSPSIFWNERFLLSEEKEFLKNIETKKEKRLSLYLAYGHYEQYPRRKKEYSDEDYAKRQAYELSLRTGDDAEDMAERLRLFGRFELVKIKGYVDEDHGSVAGSALGWAICDILDPDRFA